MGEVEIRESLDGAQEFLVPDLPNAEEGQRKENTTEGAPDARAMPGAFRLTHYGVEFAVDNDGQVEWEPVCSYLAIRAITRNAQGEDWGRVLVVRDPDGGEHRWAMPMDLLAGDGLACRERLLSLGLTIEPSRNARERLHRHISTSMPAARALAVSRLGCHDRTFVLPDRTYGVTSSEEVIYQTAGAIDQTFGTRGTLEKWRKNVAAFCVGNSRLVAAVSASFAAALLYISGDESGGIHVVGPSSIGKTTAIAVGGSVWGGGGVKGYVRQWRATANGLEATAAIHCDSLLCLDEISQVSPQEAGEVAYMLANGMGKQWAQRDGSGRQPVEWRSLFLSTGEIGLADKIGEDGRRPATAGQKVRVIDLPADVGIGLGIFDKLYGFEDGRSLADYLKQASSTYYGTASRAFLEKIVADFDGVKDAIVQYREDFLRENCPPDVDGQVKRVAARFALIAAAGELATAEGITGWDKDEAARSVAVCFRTWLSKRGGTGRDEVESAITQIRKFFELHGESRFTPWDAEPEDRATINRAGFRRKIGEGGTDFFVLPEVYKSELCIGFDAEAVAQALVGLGLLIPGSDGRTSSTHKPKALGKAVRLYHIRAEILGE